MIIMQHVNLVNYGLDCETYFTTHYIRTTRGYHMHSMNTINAGPYSLGEFGGFGRTAHSVVEVPRGGGACVCMVLGHLAWP